MRFAFTEDQQMLRDTVREVLARECTPDVVRRAWEAQDQGEKKAEGPFQTLAETGLLGMMLSEEAGGLGMNEVDAALSIEAAGYAALPEPLIETLASIRVLESRLKGDGVELLSQIAAGEARLSLALDVGGVVPFAETAVLFIVFADGRLSLNRREEVELDVQVSVDRTRSVARLRGLKAPGIELGRGEEAVTLRAAIFDRAALGSALFLNGLSKKMLELAVEYAKDRVQFGKPIGAQQAVKHHLADALIALEFSKPLAYRASWTLAENEPDYPVHVSMAKLRASEAARTIAKLSLQVHGAIGYTIEHDLHLFMKRAWALTAAYGTEDFHRARVGRAILPEQGDKNG